MSDKSKSGNLLTCDKVEGLLTDYLARELGDAQSIAVREHLRKCPDCAAKADELDQTVGLLKSVTNESLGTPTRLSQRSRDRIRRHARHPFISWIDKWQVMIYLMTLGLLFLFLMMFFSTQPEVIDDGDIIEIELPFDPDLTFTNSLKFEQEKRQRNNAMLAVSLSVFIALVICGAVFKASRMGYRSRRSSPPPGRSP